MASGDAATASTDVSSEPHESISNKQGEMRSSTQDSEYTSLPLPVTCSEKEQGPFAADQSMLMTRQFFTFPFTVSVTRQDELMLQVNEIRGSLRIMHKTMCQGFEKGDIMMTETFQQFVKEKQPSGAELREHLKQLLQQELMTSWDAMCDSLCKKIQAMVLEPQSTLSENVACERQQPTMHASHKKKAAKQSTEQSSESEKLKPAPPYPTPGKWLPGKQQESVIIVVSKTDYSEIQAFIMEKDLNHQVYNEVEQLLKFTEVKAASPVKVSSAKDDEIKPSGDNKKSSSDSDHTSSASAMKGDKSPKLEAAAPMKESAASLAETNNLFLFDEKETAKNDDITNNLNGEVHSKIKEPVKDSKEATLFSFEKLLENKEHRMLVDPTQLIALFKECEEYKQQCSALQQVLNAKSESLQQHEIIRQKSDEREQITQQNVHVQMTKNQDNFSKMMDIWREQVTNHPIKLDLQRTLF
ncbi:uncharacterized protein [Dysidea avara]|uniref:uncharacterized protein isoform X2 n=1 Tax=Dysidea avara TaxID=196820 RepID=UPI003327A124